LILAGLGYYGKLETGFDISTNNRKKVCRPAGFSGKAIGESMKQR